jgi:hypothetical protein
MIEVLLLGHRDSLFQRKMHSLTPPRHATRFDLHDSLCLKTHTCDPFS